MTLDITQPLRLAVGSHSAGSGRGCAMNVISWIMGDEEITDTPSCAAIIPTEIIQFCNDRVGYSAGKKVGDVRYLAPEHAVRLLEIAFDTIGTNTGEFIWNYDFVTEVNKKLPSVLRLSLGDEGDFELFLVTCIQPLRYNYSNDPEHYLTLARIAVDTYREMIGLTKTEHPTKDQVDSALEKMAVKASCGA